MYSAQSETPTANTVANLRYEFEIWILGPSINLSAGSNWRNSDMMEHRS